MGEPNPVLVDQVEYHGALETFEATLDLALRLFGDVDKAIERAHANFLLAAQNWRERNA